MSLIISVLCKDGAVVLADRRSRIVENGIIRFDDNYSKILRRPNALIYNHGYNRIHDRDWKLSGDELEPDEKALVYATVAEEMLQKTDKSSAYVFVTAHQFLEISIDAGKDPQLHRFPTGDDLLVSADGKKFVDLAPLTDLSERSLAETVSLIKSVFDKAYKCLVATGGTDFSKAYDVETIRG
jgi:hypothetical protein